eukprot:2013172-Pyramimonas_sp.AAC.1
MFAAHRWLAVICVLAGQCAAVKPPPRHDAGYKWSATMAKQLVSLGAPGELKSPGDTAAMMAAAIDALWVVAPDLHRATSFVEMFAGEGGTTHC